MSVDLDDTSNCPVDFFCEMCAGRARGRRVWTVASQVGIGCRTLCARCSKDGPQSTSVGAAMTAVMAHCVHLGITADEMTTLMDDEEAELDREFGTERSGTW